MQYKPVVYSNTVQSMVAILKAMERLQISFDNPDRIVSNCWYNKNVYVSMTVVNCLHTSSIKSLIT